MSAKNIFFNAAHSPIGACASFTLGFPGAAGGLGIELGKPAGQNVYIGLENRHNDHFQALPFYRLTADDLWAFEASAGPRRQTPSTLKKFRRNAIRRKFTAASDTWQAGDLTLTIISPVLSIPDPAGASPEELKPVLLPAVYLQLTVDNRRGQKARTAFIGYQGSASQSGMRRLALEAGQPPQGVAQGHETALFACQPGVMAAIGFAMPHILTAPPETQQQFGLGQTAALLVTTPPGERRTFSFAACFYRAGTVTSGLETTYYYTRLFDSLEAVAHFAVEHAETLMPRWAASDNFVTQSQLSSERKFMLAHAIRSYYASTQLLARGPQPHWVVQEGEYRMLNTLDLTTDHVFYELRLNPWTVQNVLDGYLERYSYTDAYGLSFTHDMGTTNVFSPAGTSAYELPNRPGVFSYMTHEQLVNWICTATLYAHTCGAHEWLVTRRETFTRCLASLLQRDHPDARQRDGIMDCDSDRAGRGSEITTYDSLDPSLGQARRNTYLAVKTWAAYLALEQVFLTLNDTEQAHLARAQARKSAATLKDALASDGSLPALLETENAARIIPTIEGLIFPSRLGLELLRDEHAPENLVPALRRHLQAVLRPGICLFPDGGWKLSSTSDNSWLSKIYLSQHIAEAILGFPPEQLQAADAAHANWLLNPHNAFWAWSDQMVAGKALASRFYPRGVTAILWLPPQPA